MATGETLQQAETRERPRIALVAMAAAIFTLLAPLFTLASLGDQPENLPAIVLYSNEHVGQFVARTVCSVLGLIAIAIVLDFLYRATRARNPQLPTMLRPLPWIGGLGLAAVTIGIQVVSIVNFGHFETESSFTYDEAKAAIDFGALQLIGVTVQLAFGFAFVMIAINAMRVGLLTRLLGYVGVISAVLFVIALLPVPIIQAYWLGALAFMLWGRSPTGLPPAWQSGEAMPWPSPAEMREARVREAEARRGEPALPEAIEDEAGAPSPATSRRKRKRRR